MIRPGEEPIARSDADEPLPGSPQLNREAPHVSIPITISFGANSDLSKSMDAFSETLKKASAEANPEETIWR